MSEGPNAEQETARALSEEDSDMLKAFGFDPGIPVYAIDEVDFDLDLIKRALFDSTARNPITIPFHIGDGGPHNPLGRSVDLDMVIELVQAYYAPAEPSLDSKPLGCYDAPEWYLRGFLYKSEFDPYPEVIRLHAYIATGGKDFNNATVQIVRRPSGADSSTPMVYGEDIPGQNT